MKGDLRCIEGRLFRHDPQYDDPDLETDVGECPDCSGDGCVDDGEPVSKPGRSNYWLTTKEASMTTHPAPDTSREGLLKLAAELDVQGDYFRPHAAALRALASSPAPSVEGMETDTKERLGWAHWSPGDATPITAGGVGRLARDFNRVVSRLAMSDTRANAEHERAEGLTKEVKRLKAKYEPGHTDLMVSPEAIDEALAAEAKLVAYEEPVGDWIAASCTELHERGFHREANELRRLSAVLTLAVSDVLAERKRQVTDKGYDAAHDDAHKGGEIIYDRHWGVLVRLTEYAGPLLASSPYRTALVDAGAMILAEIERLDRAALSGEEGA